ncbi:asparaginyl- tRNA synthetase, partial [Treponema pallidum]
MDVAEEFLAYLLRAALKDCAQDIAFLDERAAQHARSARGDTPLAARSTARTPPVRTPGQLTRMLEDVARAPATRLTYTEAIKLLENSGRSFEFPVRWGCDLQSEHECFLTEEVFHGPVIVYDYPKEIKAFYMKLNADGTTVRSMDLLVPGLGEIMGGSEREEQFEVLCARIRASGFDPHDYRWYTDLRRFGTAPHAGFGLGFERLLQYVTGLGNIRDVIPFPRTPRTADF